MTLIFKYRDYELGTLNYLNNEFVYNSNSTNEEYAKKNSFGALDYRLYNSKNKKSKNLFKEFMPWIMASSRQDIFSKCKINNNDNDWDILCKLALNKVTLGDYSLKIDK